MVCRLIKTHRDFWISCALRGAAWTWSKKPQTQNTHTSGARLYEQATRSTQNSVVDTIKSWLWWWVCKWSKFLRTMQVLRHCLAVRYFVVRSYSQLNLQEQRSRRRYDSFMQGFLYEFKSQFSQWCCLFLRHWTTIYLNANWSYDP